MIFKKTEINQMQRKKQDKTKNLRKKKIIRNKSEYESSLKREKAFIVEIVAGGLIGNNEQEQV